MQNAERTEERRQKRPALAALFARAFAKRRPSPEAGVLRKEAARLRRARVLRRWQASAFYRFLLYLRETAAMTSMRAYAFFLLPFGLVAFCRCLLLPLLTDDFPLLLADGAVGILLLSLFLLFFFYNIPLTRAVGEDRFFSVLFFDALALPRPYESERRGISPWLLLLFGLFFGVFAVFFSPLSLLLALFGILFVLLAFISPEFGLIFLGLFAPFAPLSDHGTLVLSVAVALIFLSYLLKLAVGKRRFSLNRSDLPILLLPIVLLLGGLLSTAGAARGLYAFGITVTLTVFSYLLAVNLLVTRRMMLSFAKAVAFTATILSAIGILVAVVQIAAPAWIDHPLAVSLLSVFSVMFPSHAAFASYLLLFFPLLLVLATDNRRLHFFYLPALLLLPVALALTLSFPVYYALLLELLLFAFLSARWRAFLPFLLLALPLVLYPFLPDSARDFLLLPLSLGNEEALLPLLDAWDRGTELLLSHPFGIGLGLSPSALLALLGAENAYNLFLHLALLLGIPFLFLLFLLLFTAFSSTLRLRRHEEERRFYPLAVAILSGLFAFLIEGVEVFAFSSEALLLLFSLLLGWLSALRRTAKEEELRHWHRPPEFNTATTEVRLKKRARR